MHKCFLAAIIFFSLISLELFPQQASLDFRIGDSLISAFKMAILQKNDTLKAKIRIDMGDYFMHKRKFMQAHEHYLAAWKTYQLIKDTSGQMDALSRIAIINRTLSNYNKALHYLKKGLTLAEKAKDKKMDGVLFDQLGLTYQAMGIRETALYFFNKALTSFHQVGSRQNEFCVRKNIGKLYLDEGRDEEGLTFFLKLLPEIDSSNLALRGDVYSCIAHIYSKKKDFRASLGYNLKALDARQNNHDGEEVNSSLINVAGDFYALEKPDSGKLYMDSGFFLAQASNRKNLLENIYRHLYNYYLKKGNYQKALDYFSQYRSLRDEIKGEGYRNNIAIIEANQQLQRTQQSGKMAAKEHDIQLLNSKYPKYQSSILKILVGLTSFSILVFVFLLLFIHRDRRKMQELHVQLSDEIKDREATEEHTRDRESQYKFITDNSDDFITQLDQQKNRIYASPASLKVYGYEPGEIIAKTPDDLTHPDYHTFTESKFAEMIETRSSRQFTYQAQKKDGTIFWVESILNPLFDPIGGDYKGMVGVTRDIQQRKIKELDIMEGTKQKEILLKEIHHRVKNNFAILVSLINMQMGQTKNKELLQSLTNLQLRIRTMALVHEMLYRSGDFEKISFPGYLRSLASVIAGTYNRRDIALTIEADEVVMDIEASIPLGLIVNEILSNSYKHGFPDGRAGNIWVTFNVDPGSGNYVLVLRDNGIGMPDGVNLDQFKTMGMQVVQILCDQIEAALVVANDNGASFTITFQPATK